jgi:hypothetical protein
MIIPVSQRRERFETMTAFEGLLTRVKPHMHLKIRFFQRSFRTVGAFESYSLTMIQMSLLEVTFQPLVARVLARASFLEASVFPVYNREHPIEFCGHPIMLECCKAEEFPFLMINLVGHHHMLLKYRW